ncbi:MAG: hypothetical protein FJX80_01500 [Bacteroidetes bacterium]|nr:hypothetical protein [Bacteroidota bacterium]
MIFKKIGYVTLSHFISSVVLFTVQVFLARTLKLSEFGALAIIQACANLIEGLVISRASDVALHLIGSNWNKSHSKAIGYIRTLAKDEYIWNFSFYFLLLIVAFPLASYLNVNYLYFVIIGLSIPAHSGYGVSKSIFIIDGKLKQLALFEIGYSIFFIIVVFVFVKLYGILGFLWAIVFSAFFKTLISKLISEKYYSSLFLDSSDKLKVKSFLSSYSIFRRSFENISTQLDVVLLASITSHEAVAIYKVAKSMANIPLKFAAPFWFVIRPDILDAMRNSDFYKLKKLILKPAKFFAILLIPSLLFLYAISDYLIFKIFGPDYLPSFIPFLILFVGTWIGSAVTGWFGFVAVISEKRKTVAMLIFLSSALLLISIYFSKGNLILLASLSSLSAILVSSFIWCLLITDRILSNNE